MPRRSGSELGALAETIIVALDAAGIGMTVTVEEDGGLSRLYSNESIARVFGYDVDEFNALPPMLALAPGEQERLAEMRRRVLAGDSVPTSLHTAIVHRDGSIVPVDVGFSSATFEGKRATVAFVRDVGDAERMEAALLASEARFRVFAEAAPDAIVVLRRGVIIYCNLTTARMLGYASANDLIGTPMSNLLAPDELLVMRDRLERQARGEILGLREYKGRRADGTVIYLEILSRPIEHGGEQCILAFGRDVTERRALQVKLIEADRMASVGIMAAGVAHEVNNPLTYVMVHLQRVRQKLRGDVSPSERTELIRLLDEALEGGERVAAIVRDLLTFSRAEQREDGPVDVGRVIRSAVDMASTAVGGHVEVYSEISDMSPVRGSEARLGQVFLNLLVNALQAVVAVELPSVAVRCTEGDGVVRVEVQDNGTGISEEGLAQMFDPFFTTKAVGSGTGLGLSIARSILEDSGGTITATNANPGLKVTVTLPAIGANRQSRGDARRPSTAPRLARSRIAIIDDEIFVARALSFMLEEDHEVAIFSDSQAAADCLESGEHFDVILCDLAMPKLSGMELHERICAARPELDRRFVFITGGAVTERARLFAEVNRARLVTKPFSDQAIAAALKRVLASTD